MSRKYPALVPLAAVIIGIILSDLWSLPSWAGLIASAALTLSALVLWSRKVKLAGLFFMAALGGYGASHFSHVFVEKGPRHLSRFATPSERYRIYGTVADWPDLKADRTELVIDVDSLVSDRVWPVDGLLLLKVSDTTTSLQKGDRLEFTGRMYPILETKHAADFDYGRFLRLKGYAAVTFLPTLLNARVDRRPVHALLRWVDDFRSTILTTFRHTLSERSSALAAGFLIGETRNIPPEIYRMFRDSGTLHLLAVSGSNVALVIGFVLVLLRPLGFSPRVRGFVLLAAIGLFVLLSYGEPSVVRAALMASLVIVARMLGRKIDLNNIVALAALFILLVSPTHLFDVGFQLSFVTAWGLIFTVPKVVQPLQIWHNRRWFRWLVIPLIISLAAQIVSTPLIAIYFHRVPVISVLANLIIVPLVSIAVVSCLAILIAYLIWPILGVGLGTVVNMLLEAIIGVLSALGGDQLPIINTRNFVSDSETLWLSLLAYLLVLLVALGIRLKVARRLALFTLVIGLLTWLSARTATAGDHEVTTLTLETVPGGIIGVLGGGENRVDVVVTGLRRRPYPIDERILSPLLERLDVDNVNSVFLLSADYGVIDDVLDFCWQHRARQIYVPVGYQAVVRDMVAKDTEKFRHLSINYFGPARPVARGQGWSTFGKGITLNMRATSIQFFDDFNFPADTALISGSPSVIVLGRRISLPLAAWDRLHALGQSRIICSRFAPYTKDAEQAEAVASNQIPPDYIVDLRRRGSLRLILGNDGQVTSE